MSYSRKLELLFNKLNAGKIEVGHGFVIRPSCGEWNEFLVGRTMIVSAIHVI